MSRKQLIIFAWIVCWAAIRAARAGRSAALWALFFVVGSLGGFYGSAFAFGIAHRLINRNGDIEEVIPLLTFVTWSSLIVVGGVILWLAGQPVAKPASEHTETQAKPGVLEP
jgi:hypothetical protein